MGQRTKTTTRNSSSNTTDPLSTKRGSNEASNDTFVITGSQYIPIEGRSETGTNAHLEGAWELDSINGSLVPGRSNINVEVLTSKLPEGIEIRHDSTTSTKTIKGVTHTTTTVLVDKMGSRGNNITPPQGANYHIPAKPGISFFGSNETVSGFTGCNKFSGRYSISAKNMISLRNVAASTKMVCIGDYDENAFLNALRDVDSFRLISGRLELLAGKTVVLVFNKKPR
ncbi:hypothetical protein SAE01_12890 [Segetibacter aerophilus]|uniref:DUF306 domain-containing protein n=1 Tax=Segetibacter aerophilus TaxID=670293 RepID=A0A512BA29_9BACT|nr:hypothetical protein SAE01_12890 [Segetibacter aerophilus]